MSSPSTTSSSFELPEGHPPIPTTSSSPFPTAPPAGCPAAASLLSSTRPSSPASTTPSTASLGLDNGDGPEKYSGTTFTLGTRNSKLAMVQTEMVARDLSDRWPGCNVRIFGMTTLGDNVQTQPLYTFGGKALWTKELEVCLLDGSCDAIVHCLKDVPTEFPPGCTLGAVLEREDPTDALVVKAGLPYTTLEELPEGSIIGTSSVRRVAQLRRKFPGLKFADVRGNLGTRLNKLDSPTGTYTALVLASAGLLRLGLGNRITKTLSSPNLYYAVGQGALGIEIREEDPRSAEIVGSLECWKTSWRTRAERKMLEALEGGCSVPVGCETTITEVWVKGGEGDDSSEEEKKAKAAVSPRTAKKALPAPSATRPGGFSPSSLSKSPNGNGFLATSPSTSTLGISPFHSAAGISPSIDETQGIPSGHPSVNPSAICPVTGRRLPSPPPRPAALLRGCTHRPGSPPRDCPHAKSASHHATLELTGTITSLSGTRSVIATLRRRIHSVEDAEELGMEIARELVAGGGQDILEELGRHVKEVGGDNTTHLDGKPIPEYVVPGGANSHPSASSTSSTSSTSAPAIDIACPVAHSHHDHVELALSPNGTGIEILSISPQQNGGASSGSLSKSPHRTVFKQGEVCQRPAGW